MRPLLRGHVSDPNVDAFGGLVLHAGVTHGGYRTLKNVSVQIWSRRKGAAHTAEI